MNVQQMLLKTDENMMKFLGLIKVSSKFSGILFVFLFSADNNQCYKK